MRRTRATCAGPSSTVRNTTSTYEKCDDRNTIVTASVYNDFQQNTITVIMSRLRVKLRIPTPELSRPRMHRITG